MHAHRVDEHRGIVVVIVAGAMPLDIERAEQDGRARRARHVAQIGAPLGMILDESRQRSLRPQYQLCIVRREPLARDLIEYALDARLILGLPFLLLRNVRLHDRDRRKREELCGAHAPRAVARERRDDRDRTGEALSDRLRAYHAAATHPP